MVIRYLKSTTKATCIRPTSPKIKKGNGPIFLIESFLNEVKMRGLLLPLQMLGITWVKCKTSLGFRWMNGKRAKGMEMCI
jgi:hypothetical protein